MDKSEVIKGNPDLLDLTSLKAIRAKCLDCCCGSSNEVKLCTKDGKQSDLCPLYQYRLGHNPNRSGRVYTEEERKAIAERLAKYRKSGDSSYIDIEDSESVYESDETIPPEENDEDFLDETLEDVYDEEDL